MTGGMMRTVFPAGKIIDNFETLGAVTSKVFTVPSGRKWIVYGGFAERDTSATFTIGIYNDDDELVQSLIARGNPIAAGTTDIDWGIHCYNSVANYLYPLQHPLLLDSGWYVKYTWGAAQSTPEVSCVVQEVGK